MTKQNNLVNRFKKEIQLDEQINDKEFLKTLKRFISENEDYSRPPRPAKDLFSIMDEVATRLDAEIPSNRAIPTGFKQYDDTYGGLIPTEMLLIGGRPSMGKTQLLVQMAINASVHAPVLYCSLDISADLLAQRFIANKADIAIEYLQLNRLNGEEKYRIQKAIKSMQDRSLLISDENRSSIDSLIKHWETYVVEREIKVMFVDYIQLLGEAKFNRNRHQELGYISQRLKKFAQEHDLALVVASQLSRSVEMRGGTKTPILSDLKESGSLEEDADKVAFIYRPEYYGLFEDEHGPAEHIIRLIFAKNRIGKSKTIFLKKTRDFNRIYSVDEVIHTFIRGTRFNEFDESDQENPF